MLPHLFAVGFVLTPATSTASGLAGPARRWTAADILSGLRFVVSSDFCERMLPRFPDQPFVTCSALEHAVLAAARTWSSNHRTVLRLLDYRKTSAACDALTSPDFASSCSWQIFLGAADGSAYPELAGYTVLYAARDVADHSSGTGGGSDAGGGSEEGGSSSSSSSSSDQPSWWVATSPNGQVHSGVDTIRRAEVRIQASRHACFYLDASFCNALRTALGSVAVPIICFVCFGLSSACLLVVLVAALARSSEVAAALAASAASSASSTKSPSPSTSPCSSSITSSAFTTTTTSSSSSSNTALDSATTTSPTTPPQMVESGTDTDTLREVMNRAPTGTRCSPSPFRLVRCTRTCLLACLDVTDNLPPAALLLLLLFLIFPLVFYARVHLPCADCFDFTAVVAHELGHVFGFGHPDEHPDDDHPGCVSHASGSHASGNASGSGVNCDAPFACARRQDGSVGRAESSVQARDDMSIMHSLTRTGESTSCLTHADKQGLLMLYPSCDGIEPADVICSRVDALSGWLHLAITIAWPFALATMVLVLLLTLIRWKHRADRARTSPTAISTSQHGRRGSAAGPTTASRSPTSTSHRVHRVHRVPPAIAGGGDGGDGGEAACATVSSSCSYSAIESIKDSDENAAQVGSIPASADGEAQLRAAGRGHLASGVGGAAGTVHTDQSVTMVEDIEDFGEEEEEDSYEQFEALARAPPQGSGAPGGGSGSGAPVSNTNGGQPPKAARSDVSAARGAAEQINARDRFGATPAVFRSAP